jgi:uncharacterized membrane protein (UPF0127 family)
MRKPPAERAAASALALVLAAIAATTAAVAPPAAATAQQMEQLPYCTRIPLPPLASCRPLEVLSGRTALHLALAANEAQRERGLMDVRSVPHGQGMLFVFPDGAQTREFWMKDTITPLDMLFVDSNGTVTGVAANVPATKRGTPDEKIARRRGIAQYVIELRAGEASALGLAAGSRLSIPPLRAF